MASFPGMKRKTGSTIRKKIRRESGVGIGKTQRMYHAGSAQCSSIARSGRDKGSRCDRVSGHGGKHGYEDRMNYDGG